MHSRQTPLLLVWLAGLVLLLLYSGSLDRDLVSPGESRVAQIAWEMQHNGNYLLPTLNGKISRESLTKPPLYHWLVIATAAPFEWQNFSLRILSLLAMLASLWLTWLLGKRLFDDTTGAWAAVVLAASMVVVPYGISARMDLFFATLILAAMVALQQALEREEKGGALLLFFLSTGLAMMVKGPAGFIIPVATAVLLTLTTRGTKELRRLFPLWGVLVFLLLGTSWYLYVALAAPPEVVEKLFLGEAANWAEGKAGGFQQRFWYYLPLLLAGLFPWSLFLLAALVKALRATWRERREPLLFLLFWFLAGLLLFSIGGKKATRYLLPILPAAALLVAWYFRQQPRGARPGRAALGAGALVTLLACGLSVALLLVLLNPESAAEWLTRGRGGSDQVALSLLLETVARQAPAAVLLALAVLTVSVLALLALRKGRIQSAILGYAFFSWMLLAVHFHLLLPLQSQLTSPRQAAEFIRGSVPESSKLYGRGDAYQRSMRWYLKRHIEKRSMDELLELARSEPDAWLFIMHRKTLPGDVLDHRPHCQWRTPRFTITFFPAKAATTELSCRDAASGLPSY